MVELDCLDFEGANRRTCETLKTAPDNVDTNVVSGVEALEQQDIERAERLYTCASTLAQDNLRGSGSAWPWSGCTATSLRVRSRPSSAR